MTASPRLPAYLFATAAIYGGLAIASASAQQSRPFVEPIHRVDHQAPAETTPAEQRPPQVASRIVPASAPQASEPFDLTQRPGEHPLMPALRVASEGLANIDKNIQDYQAILYKQERIDGELMDQEVAFVKIRHEPFSVYMFFLSPNKGRECLYNALPDGKIGVLSARDSGFRRKFGVFDLNPDGRLAMKGQKYPIYKLGIRDLVSELIKVASNDIKYGECEVRTIETELGPKTGPKRPVTLIEVTHPTPRKSFRFHKAQVFIDNEYRVPIRYVSYLWPESPGEQPPLEESYTYVNLKMNNGFTDADFDKNNPNLFKD